MPIEYHKLGMIARQGMMPIEQFLIRRPKGVPHADFCVDLERAAAQFDLASCLDGKFTQVSARPSAFSLENRQKYTS